MKLDKKVSLDEQRVRAASNFAPNSISVTDGTVDAIFATDTPVRSYHPEIGTYWEVLGFDANMIRLERFLTSAPILDNHQRYEESLGTVMNASISGKTLVGKLRFDIVDDAGKKAFGKVERGFTKSVSVGYRVHNLRYMEDGEEGLPVYMATDWEPMELSVAKVPADIKASIRTENNSKNQLTIETKMEKVLTPAEIEQKRIADEEAARIAAEKKPDVAAITKAEKTRIATITEMATKHGLDAEFVRTHVDGDSTIEAVRMAVLEKLEKKETPAVSSNIRVINKFASDQERADAMVEGQLLRMDGKFIPEEKQIKDNPFRRRTLMEMCDDFLVEKGISIAGSQRERVALAMNFAQRGSMSTSDFPNLFANVLHKILRKDYNFQTGKWKVFTYDQPATRINQPEKSINLGDFKEMEKVLEGAEYKTQAVSELAETFSVNKFGSEFAITIEMIINDDLGGISRMAEKAARMDAFTEDLIVWNLLKSNPLMADGKAVFSSAHANLGTPAALSAGSIAALRLLMVKQKGLNGKPLDINPTYIITGRSNEDALLNILNPNLMPITPADAVQSYIKLLKPIFTNYIEDNSFYLACSPTDVDTIRTGGLVGEPGFTLETHYEYKRDSWVYHARKYFGASYTDFRGLAKNAGV